MRTARTWLALPAAAVAGVALLGAAVFFQSGADARADEPAATTVTGGTLGGTPPADRTVDPSTGLISEVSSIAGGPGGAAAAPR